MVAAKLLIKPGARLWLSDETVAGAIQPLPDDVAVADGPSGATVVLVVVDDAASARAALDAHADALASVPLVWFLYPKGGRADINRDSLWPIVAEYGLRPITQVSVDEIWSALRFRPLAPGEAPFTGGRRAGGSVA